MRITKALPVVALLGIGAAAVAQGIDDDVDTNGNGVYSVEELQVLHPKLTGEEFATFDRNGDGVLNAAEYEVAAAELASDRLTDHDDDDDA